jgi:hypothetical protein
VTGGGEWDFALCAPGGKLLAELNLQLLGEDVPEVREHPWLTFLKPGEVILMREPPPLEPPFPVTFTGR